MTCGRLSKIVVPLEQVSGQNAGYLFRVCSAICESSGVTFDAALQPDADTVEAVRQMAKQLVDGPKPERLFLCGHAKGVMTFQPSSGAPRVLLLFMTPFAALDYLAATKTQFGIPYVHELIAAFARVSGDEANKNVAIEQLKLFGPQFANWEQKWDLSSTGEWTRAMAEAMTGLCLSFGIQPKLPAANQPSFLA
jgi:hypothetical protein